MRKKYKVSKAPTDKAIKGCLVEFQHHMEVCQSYSTKEYLSSIGGVAHHLYITEEQEIKGGGVKWYIDKFTNKPTSSGGAQYGSKQSVIIATTDPKLYKFEIWDDIAEKLEQGELGEPDRVTNILPIIPEGFVFYYANAGGVDEVTLELEEWDFTNDCPFTYESFDYPDITGEYDFGVKLKVNEDDTLVIHPERTFTEDEVLKLLIRCKDRFGGSELQDQVDNKEVKEWFTKQNTI